MGRRKGFDREEVLDEAMKVFWRKGYAATSVQDLVDRMGINRGSLYTTFGKKNDLFLAAIDRYREVLVAQRFAALEEQESPKHAIQTLFMGVVESAAGKDGAMGCLVTNTAVELSPHNREVSTKIANSLTLMEKAFTKALVRAQADGEIGREKDPRALARFLTSSIQGLRVMSKANPDRAKLRDVAKLALSVLE